MPPFAWTPAPDAAVTPPPASDREPALASAPDDALARMTELLRTQLERQVTESRRGLAGDELEMLRPVVRAYARLMRDTGAPIERAIIDVKAMMAQTGFVTLTAPDERACAEMVVKWCILHYFDAAA